MEVDEVQQAHSGGFFAGPISDALALARHRPGLLLVVSLQGNAESAGAEESKRLDTETWAHPDVVRQMAETTVALRLDWRSPDGASFLAIYPAFQTPTIYLIAPLTGQPLGILVGFVPPLQFLAKLEECRALLSASPLAPNALAPLPQQEPEQENAHMEMQVNELATHQDDDDDDDYNDDGDIVFSSESPMPREGGARRHARDEEVEQGQEQKQEQKQEQQASTAAAREESPFSPGPGASRPTTTAPAPATTTFPSPSSTAATTAPPMMHQHLGASGSAPLLPADQIAAKKERLLQKLEEVKQRKAAEEQQAERERELARRQQGKAALETMRTIEEIGKRKELEQRRKEKAEEARHKALVREKIRQQRAQQHAAPGASGLLRDTTGVSGTAPTTQSMPTTSSKTNTGPTSSNHDDSTSVAAIAFRLPDGSVAKAEFAVTDQLATCRQYLITEAGVRGSFALMTNFPRHTFTADEELRSLRDLQLCPAATLILTSTQQQQQQQAPAGCAAAEDSGPGFLSSAMTYLWGFFAPTATTATATAPTTPARSAGVTASAAPASQERRPATTSQSGPNVHGLRHRTSSHDEEEDDPDAPAYWNGNSTQQY